jgi:hypothetical protein
LSLLCKFGLLSLVMAANAWGSGPSELSFPQGIRDPVLPMAYVQSEKAVMAIRLSDGNAVWTYSEAGRPIAILDERLAIQVPVGKQAFRIDLISKTTGALIVRSDTTFFAQPPGSEFDFASSPSISATQTGQMLLLEWRIRRHYGGGANPPPDFAKSSPESIVHARMDLSTGRMQIESNEPAALQSIPAGREDQRLGTSNGAPYNKDGQWSDTPWNADGALVRLIEGPDSRSMILEINKPKEGNSVTKIKLNHNPTGQPPYVTSDGKYVLLQTRVGEWAVYSSSEARQIGRVLADSLAEPCVVGNRVYYRTEQLPREPTDTEKSILIAQDLATGKVEWSQTLAVIQPRNRPKLPQ